MAESSIVQLQEENRLILAIIQKAISLHGNRSEILADMNQFHFDPQLLQTLNLSNLTPDRIHQNNLRIAALQN